MDEYEFIMLYLQSDDEVKNQIEAVLAESQLCSDPED